MKVIGASLLALLLGVAAGWREGEPERGGSAVAEQDTQRPEPVRSPERVAEVKAAAANGHASGWRGWVDPIGNAKTQVGLEALFAKLSETGDGDLIRKVGLLLAARWAEIDPGNGLRFLWGANHSIGSELVAEWALLDVEAALAGLKEVVAPVSAHKTREHILKLLVRRDPDATLGFMRATRQYVEWIGSNRDPWEWLAKARPQEFAELIAELETENLKAGGEYRAYSLIRIAAAALAEQDPEAALDWGEGLIDKVKVEVMRTAMRTWATTDPVEFAERLAVWNAEQPRSERAQAASFFPEHAVSRAMANEEPAIAAKWLEAGVVKADKFTEAMAWNIGRGEQSVEEVYDAMVNIESRDDQVRRTIFSGIWGRLGVDELKTAFTALEAKPERAGRALALAGILRHTMSRDPATMVDLLGRVPEGPEREGVLGEVFRGQDPVRHGRVVEESLDLMSAADRAVAIAAVFGGEPKDYLRGVRLFQPRRYAAALESAPASESRRAAVERLAAHWGNHDPESALAWAASLPNEEAVTASDAAAGAWARQDAWSLADHLSEAEAGPTRDAATGALVESVLATEPDSAWNWAGQIDDPVLLLEVRRSVMKSWGEAQPDEARQALESAEIPAAEREALRVMLDR